MSRQLTDHLAIMRGIESLWERAQSDELRRDLLSLFEVHARHYLEPWC